MAEEEWALPAEARQSFSNREHFIKAKPAVAKAMAGEGGPSWDRTSDPLIMSQVLLTI
jgi:hypothetical protein